MELMFNNQLEIDFLLANIKPNYDVLEWGSGGSTLEIAKHVNSITSIEHDVTWFEKLSENVCLYSDAGVFYRRSYIYQYNGGLHDNQFFQRENISVHLVERNSEEAAGHDGTFENYMYYINFPVALNKKFDLIFIDGRARVECAKVAVKLLKPGGIILIHDIFHPNDKYRRFEYEVVNDFLERVDGAFTLHSFKPKAIAEKPVIIEKANAKEMCWYRDDIAEDMNKFYDNDVKNKPVAEHMQAFIELMDSLINNAHYWSPDEKYLRMLDLGCGTAHTSEFARKFEYVGADLPAVLCQSAMRNYPQHLYRSCDIIEDNLDWIKNFHLIVLNGVIDIMPDALNVLAKILQSAPIYIIIHRQEITEHGSTRQIENGSYTGNTYHSIINWKDFVELLDVCNCDIISEKRLCFTNWENNGSSFLIKKRESWALNKMDHKLYSKYFKGKTSLFYLEAGANNGRRQSNTMFFEIYKNWTGILIEPVKQNFDALKLNRNQLNICVNAALVADDYGEEVITITDIPDTNGLMSVIKTGNMIGRTDQLTKINNSNYNDTCVPARSLNSILSERWNTSLPIDLMVIDVEGYELQVLKGIDFSRWTVNHLLIEQRENKKELQDIIDMHFDLVEMLSEHDYFYKHK